MNETDPRNLNRGNQKNKNGKDGNKGISVVIPVFNEQESLSQLHSTLQAVLDRVKTDYEIIFVDDGSTDNSWQILEDIYHQENNVVVIQLRKNMGKSAALTAGFNQSGGNIVITIDADLQDDPEAIPELIAEIKKGYEVVGGYRKERKDIFFKTAASGFFNWIVKIFTGVKLKDINTGLKAYGREVIQSVELYGGLYRFLPVLAHQMGFKITEIPVKHYPRKFGKSKYGPGKIVDGSIDLLTVILLTKYSEKPAHFFGGAGIFSFTAGFLISLYLTIKWFLGYQPIGNRPLFFLGILLLIIGIQLVSLGLLGEILVKERKNKTIPIKKVLVKNS